MHILSFQITANFQELTHTALCQAAKIWVSGLHKEWLLTLYVQNGTISYKIAPDP